MNSGARTPEELETLLEDSCLIGGERDLTGLFEDDALVLTASGAARGAAAAPLAAGSAYVAGPARILQTRDTALIIARSGVSVVRRREARWRYAIALLSHDTKGPTP